MPIVPVLLDDVDICDIGVDSIVVNGHAERLAVFQSEVRTISEKVKLSKLAVQKKKPVKTITPKIVISKISVRL